MEKGIEDITRALRQAAQILSGVMDEPEIIQILLREVSSITSAQRALVLLQGGKGNCFVIAGSIGLSDAYLKGIPTEASKTCLNQRAMSGEILVLDEIGSQANFTEAAEIEGLHGAICIPLFVRDHSIGVLHAYVDVSDPAARTSESFEILKTLADMGAIALERVRHHKSLLRIAKVINSTLELQPMLQGVLEATVQEMWLNASSIRLLDPGKGTLELIASYGLSEYYMQKGEIHLERSEIDRRVMDGETVALHDIEHEAGLEYPEEAAREGILSVLAAPLKLKGVPVGVMRVYSAQPRGFGPVGTALLESVAHLVSLAIENAELYATLKARYKDLKVDLAEWRNFLALG